MTTQELYDQIGGNYTEALSRMSMDALVARFVVRFLDDSSCNEIVAAWKAGNDEAAFKAAHAAKGVCANLSLTHLSQLSSDICEALRPGNEALRAQTDVDALVAQLETDYESTIARIKEFQNG